ncbi:MAG TPA: hypothetical protein VGQ28_16940, partial [Thermoanaerobaculia bacterium]|nr:hypothetical protein [Thermoanaerobaculia bacterium]
FHVEHHEKPAVHWSELPRLHAAMKPELIAGGAHIVPYGIYRASSLLNSFFHPKRDWQRFLEQHPDYLPVERPTEMAVGEARPAEFAAQPY